MTEWVEFPNFVTKGITVESGDERRIFKGHMTAEIIDRQQEFIFVKEVMKIMETFMSVNPVLSDFHSNRMVGRVLKYEEGEYQGVKTVLITGEVYKKDGVTLYDKVWDKVIKGEYSGLSMGGASKEREPIMKDGKMALELRKLELYEIALCDTPANPFAIIESVNMFAKATGLDQDMIKESNGREYIQCTSLACRFEKGTDMNVDVDIDNHEYVCTGGVVCDICKKTKEEHGLDQFDKPKIRDMPIPEGEDQVQEKYKKDASSGKTLVQRSAQTRSDNVGGASDSPKDTNDILTSIPRAKTVKPFGKDTLSTSTTFELDPEDQKKRLEGRIKDNTITKKKPVITTPGGIVESDEVSKIAPIVARVVSSVAESVVADAASGGDDDVEKSPEAAKIHSSVSEDDDLKSKLNGELAGQKTVSKLQPIVGRKNGEDIQESSARSQRNEVVGVEKDQTVPEDTPKHWKEKGVNAYIKYFGVEIVREELLKIERLSDLKKMLSKYN